MGEIREKNEIRERWGSGVSSAHRRNGLEVSCCSSIAGLAAGLVSAKGKNQGEGRNEIRRERTGKEKKEKREDTEELTVG